MDLLQPMLLTSLALPRALPFYLAWDDLDALKLCDMALQRSDLLEWKPLDGLVHLIHAMRLRPQVYGNLLDTWLRLSQGVSAAYDIEGQRILFQLRTIIQATLRVLSMDCPVHHTRRTLQLSISPGQYQQMLNYADSRPMVVNSLAADDDAGDLFLRATEQLWILWYTLPDFVLHFCSSASYKGNSSRGPCRERGIPYKSSCRVILTGLIASPVYQAKAVCKRLRSRSFCFKSFAPPPKKKGGGWGDSCSLFLMNLPFGTTSLQCLVSFVYCWIPILLAPSLPETPIALCAIRLPYRQLTDSLPCLAALDVLLYQKCLDLGSLGPSSLLYRGQHALYISASSLTGQILKD